MLNPWASEDIKDYSRIIKEFGLKEIGPDMLPDNPYVRRGIVFAHRDLDLWIEDARNGNAAILTGIKPSGPFHLGTLMTAVDLAYFHRKFGVPTYYCVADVEAYEDNGLPYEESERIAVSHIAHALALGLSEDTYFYFQSHEKHVMRMAFKVARLVTDATLRAVYGEHPLRLYMAALLQVGDILLPQKDGKKRVLVPVGIDQDPHIRLTRDVAHRMGLVPPAATYHRLMRSLTGEGKMSKRDPMSYLSLDDPIDLARKKVYNAFTGGRATAEEQREKGGRPDICMVFTLATYFMDDEEIRDIHDKCVSGQMLCGECKKRVWDKIEKFLIEHRKKYEEKLPLAREIVKEVTR